MTDWVADLCRFLGVYTSYRGFEGQTVEVSRDTLHATLGAMEPEIATEEDARDCLHRLQADQAARIAPREVIVSAGHGCEVTVSEPVDWVLEAEGAARPLVSGHAETVVVLPALPIGIHRLLLRTGRGECVTWVLARPPCAVSLADHTGAGRSWGVLAALYGMTDGRGAAIGNYDLLGRYAAAMAAHGADFLGINPVHAMGPGGPDTLISPYSPSHRAFLNTWHCAQPGLSGCDLAELIDYPAVLHDNEQALARGFSIFRSMPVDAPDRVAFQNYTDAAGAALDDFALFQTLAGHLGPDWRDWPAKFRSRDHNALAAIARERAGDIAQVKWAQWLADAQLAQAQQQAVAAGMRIGLYLDLAVGPQLGGAETWARDSALVTGATLGAPPDPLGPTGQSWGLAPQSPRRMQEQGYAGFARLLRAVMRHAGMIRIDHILGLMRSFWIPEGCTAGTYVSYPFEALLAVVAIESQRNGTIVVGEDLGLVPGGLRESLSAAGIYGLDVLQFMRTSDGGFVDGAQTRERAICAFATHDTPTIAGFFTAQDARLRAGFGDVDAPTLAGIVADRQRAADSLETTEPVTAIHHRLARARSDIVAVQLDDIAERIEQQNLPGTVDEYPNWRRKAPFTVNEITTSDSFARLGADMAAQNRSNSKGNGTGS